MARIRNYQAEEQRRNEIARERGYTSRAQQRGKVEKGLVSGRPLGPAAPLFARAGFTSPAALAKARKEAATWSAKHSQKRVSEYRPKGLHANGAAFRAYYNAYINPATAISVIGKRQRAIDNGALNGIFDGGPTPVAANGMNALQNYLLDWEDYDESEVYDSGYNEL